MCVVGSDVQKEAWMHSLLHKLYVYLQLVYLFGPFYRPAYRQLLELSIHFPGIPIMALSATIVPSAQERLQLMLPDCDIIKGSVNRPNVYLEAHPIRSFSTAGKLRTKLSRTTLLQIN